MELLMQDMGEPLKNNSEYVDIIHPEDKRFKSSIYLGRFNNRVELLNNVSDWVDIYNRINDKPISIAHILHLSEIEFSKPKRWIDDWYTQKNRKYE